MSCMMATHASQMLVRAPIRSARVRFFWLLAAQEDDFVRLRRLSASAISARGEVLRVHKFFCADGDSDFFAGCFCSKYAVRRLCDGIRNIVTQRSFSLHFSLLIQKRFYTWCLHAFHCWDKTMYCFWLAGFCFLGVEICGILLTRGLLILRHFNCAQSLFFAPF